MSKRTRCISPTYAARIGYDPSVEARLRYYHPEYRPSWRDKLYDFFSVRVVPPRPPGVEYHFLDRLVARTTRQLLDGVVSLQLLGQEMVRVESAVPLPPADDARAELCGELVGRLRFGQIQPDGRRVALPVRWIEFASRGDNLVLFLRTVGRPDPGLRSFLAANLGASGQWTEVAIAGE